MNNRYLLALALSLSFTTPGAYAQSTKNVEDGKLIFEDNCVACHGEDAKEGDSGDIRDADFRMVRMATGGIEDMPEFEFTEDELKSIVAYLNSLLD